ncbi:MAG TPA: hypothetical protein PLZ21_01895 [Armatimonadota bacterium]|nr:hypothetical protein [Armatimonadota bacterium]
MKDDVVLLAVTKMLSGFCIGGISLSTGKWVRPVKEHGTILLGDIRYQDGTVMRPFDVVRFELTSHRPKPPHIEDWVCDFIKARPELVDRLEDEKRWRFLKRFAVSGGERAILSGNLSLILCSLTPTAASFSLDSYSGKYDARVYVRGIESKRGIPVTDLKWRALGRMLLTTENPLKLSAAKLRAVVGIRQIYLALGLSRLHEGRHWPLVVGVHTFPDYESEIDYSQP